MVLTFCLSIKKKPAHLSGLLKFYLKTGITDDRSDHIGIGVVGIGVGIAMMQHKKM
jgi:hypothetical protein